MSNTSPSSKKMTCTMFRRSNLKVRTGTYGRLVSRCQTKAKGKSAHFTGTTRNPLTPTDEDSVTAHTKWTQTEDMLTKQLARCIKDATLHSVATDHIRCRNVRSHSNPYRRRPILLEPTNARSSRTCDCPDKGNVRQHLTNICAAHDELINVGITITDKDYTSVMIRSLPKLYSDHISHLSAAAHLVGKKMDPDTMMIYIVEEYDRLSLEVQGGEIK